MSGLVEMGIDFAETEVDERVVERRASDIAGPAGEIAQRPRIEPQGPEPFQRNPGPRLASGRDLGVAELGRIEPRESRILERR